MMQTDLPKTFNIPARFKDVPLPSLFLSLRLSNVLQSLNFQTLGDLQDISVEEFKATRHCGEKTVRELISIIEKIRESKNEEDLAEIVVLPENLTLERFIKFVDRFVSEQKELTQKILSGRFGADSEKGKTLEVLGTEFGLTRERIRQISTSAMEKLKTIFDSAGKILFEEINQDCIAGVFPLTPQLLFLRTGKTASDFRFRVSFYLRILSELAPQIPIFPERYFSQSKSVQPRPYKIYRQIRLLLGHRYKSIAVKKVFETIKESGVIENLQAAEFLQVLRCNKEFALNFDAPEAPTIQLIVKPKAHEIAYIVLSESEHSLKPDEIIERAKEMFGENNVSITVYALLHLPTIKKEFYLLDKRTIGLRQHLSFPPNEWDTVKNDFYKLLKKHRRSYSTKEVVFDKLFPWADRISPNELAQILREDRRLIDLGRLNFALKQDGIRKREKISDLVVKVLREADHPLQPMNLKEAIQKRRTVHSSGIPTVVRQHPEIEDYGYGFYGLKEWKDSKLEYLLTNETFIFRILIMSETPLKFGDLCKRLGIEKNQMLVKILWERLRTMPKTELKPNRKAPDTLILYNSIGKIRYRKKNFPNL